MNSLATSPLLLCAALLYLAYRRITRISLADIPGPKPQSFWIGNIGQLFKALVGEVDFEWQEQFGGIARIKGPLGQDMLWVSDPKALQYILHTGGYNFPKSNERLAITKLFTDNGLVAAQGDSHKRQRKVMLPAFGMPESKALFPIFSRCAESITAKWKDELFDTPDQSKVYNIPPWLSFAALDAIGEAAFDRKFGAMDNSEDEFVQAYQNLLVATFAGTTDGKIIFQALTRFVPSRLLELLYNRLPQFRFLHRNRVVAHKFAKEMLEDKNEALERGAGRHDVMSILVRANTSEDARTRLSEGEMISQMRTILLAGHETTATSLGWGLLELAKKPEVQAKLRKEIHEMEATLHARGRANFSPADLEAMPYTQACLKEMLRMQPAVYHNHRVVGKDLAIPLSKPIRTVSGKEIKEVPVSKGTRLVLSLVAYNRDKAVWGEDAHEFNPERWLNQNEKRDVSVGVYGNLATFSGGIRGCIGWRFAVMRSRLSWSN